tara:strand:+ start:852 stop:1229 length:378 start_codon:yes stop_codon:yes gene_type:complete
MPEVTRTHPANLGIGLEFFIGKPCTFLMVDFGAAVDAKTGPESTIARVVREIADSAEILIKGDLHGSNQIMSFLVAHGNEADTYDGSNSETLAQHIEDKIQAAGTVDGINLASATCVVKTSLDFA